MSYVSLTFEGVEDAEQVNRLTTALMQVEGVESVEVGRHGAEIEGKARRAALVAAVERLGVKVR